VTVGAVTTPDLRRPVSSVGGVVVLTFLLAACTSPGGHHGHARTTTTTASTPPTTSAAASGVRTVLSPVGLNIRAQPSASGAVEQTAAQGTVVTVLGQTDQNGGWFQVKGTTVTGWISSNPTLSAPGRYTPYSSVPLQVSLLYPAAWTVAEQPPASTVFHVPPGHDTVVVSTASTVDQLGRGRAGFQRTNSEQVVVCGVTTMLATYSQTGATASSTQPAGVVSERYLAQVHLTLDPMHALGIDANLSDLSQLDAFRSIVDSVTFPFPQCRP
jgi:hypothetical protein